MRLVLDTNALVSALLKPGSVPDRALMAIWSTGAVVLYDARFQNEYREVLLRPRFHGIDRQRIADFMSTLAARGHDVGPVEVWNGPMADDDDRMFVEVALAGRADAIVTGNLRHFPGNLGFDVHPPASLLAILD